MESHTKQPAWTASKKRVYWTSDQAILSPGHSAAETSQIVKLCRASLALLSEKRMTVTLFRLRACLDCQCHLFTWPLQTVQNLIK